MTAPEYVKSAGFQYRNHSQNGVSVQIIDKFSTLKSRLPHIRPGIVTILAAAIVSEIAPSSASTTFLNAHAPQQHQQASPQQHSSITATQIHQSQASPQPFSFFASFCGQIISLSPSAFPIERPAPPHRPLLTFPAPS
jgi:hypothetical protein